MKKHAFTSFSFNISNIFSVYPASNPKSNVKYTFLSLLFPIAIPLYLFINSVKIEYNYYVKKEQARQEQLAIKEQMRQEAEERKALAAEKAKVEKEETKQK